MFSVMTVYYQYLKPNRDYIQFTRDALAGAKGRDITILGADEVLQGTLPMLTGKTYKVVPSYTDILPEGVYIWADRKDKVLRQVSRHADLKILHERRMDIDGNRVTRLVYIVPRISKSSEFSVPPAAAPAAPAMPEPGSGDEGKAGY
jgi:hypothetical protein